jgi:hypothetical protein
MTLRSWSRNLFARPVTRPIRKAVARFRPRVEALEARLTPTTFHVTSLLDDGSAGTLRAAINQANANPGADTIDFQVSGTISLKGGNLPAFTDAARTSVTGPAGGLTLDAHGTSRIFQVNLGASAALRGLTLANGSADQGGGIYNSGTLSLTDCTLSHNAASGTGGGIYNTGTLSLTSCTLAGNAGHSGGAIEVFGSVSLTNCTLAGNSASDTGGGIRNGGMLSITNCTLAGNSAQSGGGITNARILSLNNSIVANSPHGGDISGDFSGGNNLTGAVALGPLADYGGPTQTMALPAASPAIGAATIIGRSATDQRGLPRDASPDIGAFEVGHTIVVTTLPDEGNGTPDPGAGTGTSLREAIAFADKNPGADTITFAVSGTVSLGGTQLPAVSDDLTIAGPAGGLTVDAHAASRILQVNDRTTVAVSGLTLVNGRDSSGGGIENRGGTLSLAKCALAGNSALEGGGIRNQGRLSLTNCTLAGNSATNHGGGIENFGWLSLTNCTLSANSASTGGGIVVSGGTLSLNNSIVANSPHGGDIVGSYSGGHNLIGAVALGPLADYGGPTQTMALPAGSPAIGAADSALAPATDQRGVPRDTSPDIGAFEFFHSTIVVTTLADEDDGFIDPGAGTGTSLREAIAFADKNPGADTITFAVGGSISLNRNLGSLAFTDAATTTITGPSEGVRLDGHNAGRIFEVNAGAKVSLAGLTLINGFADWGGGIRNDGTMSLTNCTLAYNRGWGIIVTPTKVFELGGGGGIYNTGMLALSNCTFAGNLGYTGGGIRNDGTMSVTNCTLSGNHADEIPFGDGSIVLYGGGGIYNTGTMSLNNSIVANSPKGANIVSDAFSDSHNLIGNDIALGPLADNGGPTQTMALPAGSPALDAADAALAPATDQRGLARDPQPDIGAFEAQKPTLTRSLTAVTVNEGSPATNAGTFDDSLGRAMVTLTASLGTITRDDSTGIWSWSYTPDDGPSGPTTVTLTATNFSGLTATATFTLTVNNVAPAAAVSGPSDGVRGQARTFALTASDSSSVDQAAGFTFAVDWGDGTTQTVTGPSGTAASHTFTVSGTYNVWVTATDKDGDTSAAATRAVTITAVALQTDPTDPGKTALVVGGTTGADTITIKPADAVGTLDVKIGSTNMGSFTPTGHVIVYGQAGDDSIELQTSSISGAVVRISQPAFLFGGDGKDSLDASGSSGDNVLQGGAGNDNLRAGSGRELLVGGLGADVLQGNAGDDILVGGTTDYDSNLAALNAVMSEWGRTDADYQTRVNHLKGTLGGGSNGDTLLTATTVRDDAATDTLIGEGGTDWFFALLSGPNQDKVKDQAAGELITGL